MRTALTTLILFVFIDSWAQLNINLSPRHQNKLSEIKSGHKRIKQFHKYFSMDSARRLRHLERKARKELDSAAKANGKKELLADQYPRKQVLANPLDSLGGEITRWKLVLADTASPDSLKAIAASNVRDFTIARLRYYPNFYSIEGNIRDLPDSASWQDLSGQVPGIDSLKTVFANPKDLMDHSIKMSEERFGSFTKAAFNGTAIDGFGDAASAHNTYKDNLTQYKNLRESPKIPGGSLNKQSIDSLTKRPEVLEAATQKVSDLFSKYSSFPNSNDLSDAKKRTSLEGKTFFERIIIGGTFNVVSTAPVSIDFAPQVGYRFTSLFTVGVGMNYRATFGDSINCSWHVSSRNIAVKAFASYEILSSWFFYGESQFSSLGKNKESKNEWNANYFIGIGKKFLVHPKLHMTLTALYNLNSETQNQLYPQRFQIRVGFQTSDLAFRKKQVNYDPNR